MLPEKRIYLLPENGNLYKANLHCHSTISDGKFTPEELKKMYMERGYHAIAYTDHQVCVPHNELTDENFVALTGLEIAFGIGKATSVHLCGISRDSSQEMKIPNDLIDDIDHISGGARLLKEKNCVTTLNHPRWSGISPEGVAAIGEFDNMEIVNGYEMIQDGYGDSSACCEAEMRRGRKIGVLAADDSHTMREPGKAGYEYFQGFTMLKAPGLTYDSLINALDEKAFYASTGPIIHNLWLENGILHVECSPVCSVYVHGNLYSNRAAVVKDSDCIESIDIDLRKAFSTSKYIFVQIVDTNGKKAWAHPYWLD